MQASKQLTAAVVMALATAFALSSASAHDDSDHGDHNDKVVTVAFGNGINTAQPGNSANHHVLPGVIKVQVGDVVNFVVSGLHVIRVFDKGVSLKDVKNAIPVECQTNPPAVPPFAPISVDQNRVEAVSFSKAGRFLVICGVLPHFNDGMYAWIEVDRDHH
jgi:plastocyanin